MPHRSDSVLTRDFFVSQLQTVENDNRMVKEGAGFIWEKTSRHDDDGDGDVDYDDDAHRL